MTAYLTPETAEALRKALHDKARTGIFRSDYAVSLSTALEIIDSLPVVGAVPAEEALDRIEGCNYPADACAMADAANADFAAVRHALRAATATEELAYQWDEAVRQCGADPGDWGGTVESAARSLLLVVSGELEQGDPPDPDTVAHKMLELVSALRAAQAQADAPPPPDVIRRGHEALDGIAVAEYVPDDGSWEDAVADVRATMPPLPKEE